MNKVVTIALMLLAVCMNTAKAAPKVEFVESKDKIDVKIAGRIVTTYIYGDKLPKSSFVPVRSLSGVELTRRYPLTELAGGSDNEPHHVGMYFTADEVNGMDFWNNTSNSPQIKHILVVTAKVRFQPQHTGLTKRARLFSKRAGQ